jgi:hypothetical protein
MSNKPLTLHCRESFQAVPHRWVSAVCFKFTDCLTSCACSDFYNVRKVDTHVHHSASFNQKHLLRFIKSEVAVKHAPKS